MALRLNFRTGFILDTLPGWAEVIALPHEEKKKVLADPARRAELDARANSEEAGVMRALAIWQNATITETFTEANRAYEGRKVGEIAETLGRSPFDALVDIALSEDLRTTFSPFIPGDDDASWKMRAEAWLDDRTIIGASDAGAHLDMINTFMCTTALLGDGVRERGLISLEQAVEQLTRVPATHYGLRERGLIAEGYHADITLFDPASVGPHPMHTRPDLPAGAGRLYAEADGIAHVIVGGVEIYADGELTGATPGHVLRSGRDTETVEVPGGATA
jgi:N-acyl-D-aspartate/D-glutamate deacylase